MIPNQPRENAIVETFPTVDLTDYVGCAAYYRTAGTRDIKTLELWDPNDHNLGPQAIISAATADNAAATLTYGGLSGTVLVKAVEEISGGNEIYFVNNGTDIGFADRDEESYAGTWYVCGMAVEGGQAGDFIEACICKPFQITI
jgi:hypothetical protein